MSTPDEPPRGLGRLWRRGWRGALHARRTLPRIEQWQWGLELPPAATPVHVLVGEPTWHLAAWMLASWFTLSERAWRVVFHDDGTLPARAAALLPKLFPRSRLLARSEADAEMDRVLKPFPFCYEHRALHPHGLKIFDVTHFAEGERFLLLDPDVLFFNFPRALLERADGLHPGDWFLMDTAEHASLQAEEAREELGVELRPRVHTGMAVVRRSTVSFHFCDEALAQTSIVRGPAARVEATLYALCAAKAGGGGPLPAEYEVATARRPAPEVVARLYRGPARDWYFAEGLPRLAGQLLPAPEPSPV